MRLSVLFVFVLFMISSCSKEEENQRSCIEADYGESFSMQVDDEVCFPDGRSLTFELVSHEYCPCEVICIWEGEMRLMLETTDGDGTINLKEYGSVSYKVYDEIFETLRISKIEIEHRDSTYLFCENDALPEDITVHMTIES